MDLLFFLKSGLMCSAKRWKLAFDKNKCFLFCVISVYFVLCFFEFSWWWSLPVGCYFIALLMTLVLPDDAMTVGKGEQKNKYLVYALGDSQFGVVHDGIFLKVHQYKVESITPIKTYKRCFGRIPMMLVEWQKTGTCYLYSQDYPKGLNLGFPLDEDLVVFRDGVLPDVFVVEPGKVSRLFNVKKITQGESVYSEVWSKAIYYRSDMNNGDGIDAFKFQELCYYNRIDTQHFLLIEFQDGWFKLFFVLINKNCVIDVLDVRNLDMVRFETENKLKLELHYDATKQMYSLAKFYASAE